MPVYFTCSVCILISCCVTKLFYRMDNEKGYF
uniref:Uncharacterized protein n=1 Tax=Anguilla anguilla TaxID=7936 RepID=A0A0E9VH35_ANGAN